MLKMKFSILYRYLYFQLLKMNKHANSSRRRKKLFNKLKNNVLSMSDFYKPHLDKPLSEFPIIDKKKYMKNFDTINTSHLEKADVMEFALNAEQQRSFGNNYKGLSIGLSSGTSGNRGLFITSDAEKAAWVGYVLSRVLPSILKPQRVALFLRANNSLYESMNSKHINFQFFDLFQPFSTLLANLNQFQPTVLVAPAKVLAMIAKQQNCLIDIKPEKIISAAEVLEDYDKKYIETVFTGPVHQLYQCTEGFLAHTCDAGNLHLNEDIVFIEKEWIDRDSGRFVPIITDMMRKTQPIVRYRLDDILIENNTPCPCGSNFTRIDKIEGRCDDILYFNNMENKRIPLFPDYIRRAILVASSRITDYRVEQLNQKLLRVSLNPLTQAAIDTIKHSLNRLFRQKNIEQPTLEFQLYHPPLPHQKSRRVLRNIKNGEKR